MIDFESHFPIHCIIRRIHLKAKHITIPETLLKSFREDFLRCHPRTYPFCIRELSPERDTPEVSDSNVISGTSRLRTNSQNLLTKRGKSYKIRNNRHKPSVFSVKIYLI